LRTHIHLIAFDAEFNSDRLIRAPADFRKFTGRRLSDYVGGRFPACFGQVLRVQAAADCERRLCGPAGTRKPSRRNGSVMS
jgi:hypothetical protein